MVFITWIAWWHVQNLCKRDSIGCSQSGQSDNFPVSIICSPTSNVWWIIDHWQVTIERICFRNCLRKIWRYTISFPKLAWCNKTTSLQVRRKHCPSFKSTSKEMKLTFTLLLGFNRSMHPQSPGSHRKWTRWRFYRTQILQCNSILISKVGSQDHLVEPEYATNLTKCKRFPVALMVSIWEITPSPTKNWRTPCQHLFVYDRK
jgi:hypothetical protein